MKYGWLTVPTKDRVTAGQARLATPDMIGKIAPIMFAQALTYVKRWLNLMLSRRLRVAEAVAASLLLLTAGTIYCQIYCLLALQEMHGASMPLWASVHRASVDVIPPFVAFELSKRVPMNGRVWQWAALIAIFAAAIAIAVLWRMQLDIMSSGLSPRRMAVDRIPYMALAGVGLFLFHHRGRLSDVRAPWSRTSDDPDKMPPAKAIDWVKAAGNYVEIRVGGRTRLLRMTLRQASSLLPDEQFVQIHRSVIVNRERIAKVNGRRSVEMTDGTAFTVGDAYRSNLTAV